MACILLRSSAVRVHDSLTYRKMDVTRERISRILELREILQSFQTGFSLVKRGLQEDIDIDLDCCREVSELVVSIFQCRDLPPNPYSGTLDTFIKGILIPNSDDKFQTKVCV